MKFKTFITRQVQLTLSSSLAIGLVIGILILVTGGAEGSLAFDIDLSQGDIVWFLVGTPLFFTLLFLLFSPLAFLIHRGVSRAWDSRSTSAGRS